MRSHIVYVLLICVSLLVGPGNAFSQDAPAGGSLQQEGFTPIDELPPQDQLPAAPLLIGAYVFVLVVLFAYVFSIARRLSVVQQQVERLEGSVKPARKS